MSKIFLVLFILSLFTFPKSISADSVSLSVTPKTVNLKDKVTVSITNLPRQTAGYMVNVSPSSASITGGGIVANIQILTDINGSCTTRVPSDAWVSSSCTGVGPFNFTGEIDSDKIGVNPNSTLDLSYSVIIGGSTAGSNLATDIFIVKAPKTSTATFSIDSLEPNPAKPGTTIKINLSSAKPGNYSFGVSGSALQTGSCTTSNCVLTMQVPNEATNPTANVIVRDPDGNSKSTTLSIDVPTKTTTVLPACTEDDVKAGRCTSAAGKACSSGSGIDTAFGCIPTSPANFVKALLTFAMGIAGGIAFLLMVTGAFQMITSAGNPESLKSGQERFSSAIIGLLFVIFSVLLLKIIGVDLLDFGKFFV